MITLLSNHSVTYLDGWSPILKDGENKRLNWAESEYWIVKQFIQLSWLYIKTSELYLIEYVGLATVKSKKKILTGENAAWINLISLELLEKVLMDKFTKPGIKTLVSMPSFGALWAYAVCSISASFLMYSLRNFKKVNFRFTVLSFYLVLILLCLCT